MNTYGRRISVYGRQWYCTCYFNICEKIYDGEPLIQHNLRYQDCLINNIFTNKFLYFKHKTPLVIISNDFIIKNICYYMFCTQVKRTNDTFKMYGTVVDFENDFHLKFEIVIDLLPKRCCKGFMYPCYTVQFEFCRRASSNIESKCISIVYNFLKYVKIAREFNSLNLRSYNSYFIFLQKYALENGVLLSIRFYALFDFYCHRSVTISQTMSNNCDCGNDKIVKCCECRSNALLYHELAKICYPRV